MKTLLRAMTCVAVIGVASLAATQGSAKKPAKPTTPEPGSKLRKAVLDSLRPSIEEELKVRVRFKIDRLSVLDGWAFVSGVLLDTKDRPIDLKKTRLREEAEYMDGPSIYALTRYNPTKKKWLEVTHVIGPTDVAWSDWHVRFKCPKAILGIPALSD